MITFSNVPSLPRTLIGATDEQLNGVERSINSPLPTYYREALKITNGLLLDSGLSIYSTDDIIERNETYEIKEYCNGFLLIGDDSGGRGFLIKISDPQTSVYSSGLGDLEPSTFKVVAHSLEDWINQGLPI
ncbi:SMI1/KNR4 family protein [Chitinimonas sp. JJ19]|uniref:SMI1/KNR4 family protein n=1 Tax=Chitinimonas sp. JJ19 TaxID=3109352 RepID=UPI002FFF48D1